MQNNPLTETDPIDLIPENAKYTIVTDWFSAILTGHSLVKFDAPLDEYIYDLGNIIFKRLPYSAPMFNFAYEITFRGKVFGNVQVSPKKNGVLKKDCVQFKVENNIMYEVGWLDDVKYFLKKMEWNVTNVSRVDIALDGKGFFNVWNKYVAGDISRKGGNSKEQDFRISSGGERKLTGFDVGSRSSDKWITCYNKTLELKSSNKDYIPRFWERSGLDIKSVERLELKLKNDALKEINFDWMRMDDFEYLASVFRTFIEGGFIIYECVDERTGECLNIEKQLRGMLCFIEKFDKTKDKNISRKKKIKFIDWDYIGATPLERFSTQKSNEVWAMKLTAKRLVWLSIATEQKAKRFGNSFEDVEEKNMYLNRSRNFMSEAYEVAKNVNCLQWLIDKFPAWQMEYSNKRLDYIPDFQVANANEQLKLVEVVPQHRMY